jgi:hypothetical protein
MCSGGESEDSQQFDSRVSKFQIEFDLFAGLRWS